MHTTKNKKYKNKRREAASAFVSVKPFEHYSRFTKKKKKKEKVEEEAKGNRNQMEGLRLSSIKKNDMYHRVDSRSLGIGFIF